MIEGDEDFQRFLGPQAVEEGQRLSEKYTTGLRRRDPDEIEKEKLLIKFPEQREEIVKSNQDLLGGINDLIGMTKNSEGFKMVDLKAEEQSKRNEAKADEIVEVGDGETEVKKKNKKKKRKNKKKNQAEEPVEEEK